jgi:1-acyl-sn-glycerol-3-phosphate acyltransferase
MDVMKVKKEQKIKDFGYYLFQVVRYPLKWYMKSKLKLKLVKNELVGEQRPFFIVGNHVTNYDPLITLAYSKQFVRFVAASNNFDNRLKRILFKIARVIPINKKNSDIQTIRTLLKEAKGGNSVGLFPEGGRTWDGKNDEIIYSTAKLIKLLKLPLYNQVLHGAYFTTPRWCKTTRKGELRVEIYKLLEVEQIKAMSDEEIYQVLLEHISYNDYDYQREAMIPYYGKDLAMYVERLVYACPNCKSMNQIYSNKDDFYCSTCNSKGTINRYQLIEGDFPYDNLVEFNDYQKEILPHYIENEFNELFIEGVPLKRYQNQTLDKAVVNVKIDKNEISLDYIDHQEVIALSDISPISLTFENTFTFYVDQTRYQFTIEPFLHSVSIMFIHDLLNTLRGN